MVALRHDAALVQHHDAVRLLDRSQPVSDHQGGAILRGPFQRLLHQLFRFSVQGAGGFVQQQQRRILQNGAGDGDALALAAGQTHAAFAQIGVVALRQLFDEAVRGGGAGRGPHFLIAGLRFAVADVLQGAGAENHRILQHHAHMTAQIGKRQFAHIHATQQYLSLLRIVKPQQELKQGGLARAGRAHQRHMLAGAHAKPDAAERRLTRAGRVGEIDIAQLQAGGPGRQSPRRGRLHHRRTQGQQFHQPLGGAGRPLHIPPHFRQRADGAGGDHRVQDELPQLAGAHRALKHRVRAQP